MIKLRDFGFFIGNGKVLNLPILSQDNFQEIELGLLRKCEYMLNTILDRCYMVFA